MAILNHHKGNCFNQNHKILLKKIVKNIKKTTFLDYFLSVADSLATR